MINHIQIVLNYWYKTPLPSKSKRFLKIFRKNYIKVLKYYPVFLVLVLNNLYWFWASDIFWNSFIYIKSFWVEFNNLEIASLRNIYNNSIVIIFNLSIYFARTFICKIKESDIFHFESIIRHYHYFKPIFRSLIWLKNCNYVIGLFMTNKAQYIWL